MFKKIFSYGWVFILMMGMILYTVPAHARGMGSDAAVVNTVYARIKKVTLLSGYPPKLKIVGTLPSPCYSPSALVVMYNNSPDNGSVNLPNIKVDVMGKVKPNTVCASMLVPFSLNVSINPVKLKINPGKYIVLVNPVNSGNKFRIPIRILPTGLD